MRRLRLVRRPCEFGSDSDGAVAVVVGIALVALIGSAALSVDVGTLFLAKRNQQAATDIAAIVAAGQIANAAQAVPAALASNGVGLSAQTTIEYGNYVPDPATSPDQRFQPGLQASADAIRIGVVDTAPLYLGSALVNVGASATGQTRGIAVRTVATASQANFAAFAVGSRLASLNGGVANAVLGKLLETQLSLSVMDYQALASAQVDLFAVSRNLATRITASGLTYGQLASMSVHLGDLFAALRDGAAASGTGGTASTALAAIAQAEAGSGYVLPLAPLVDFGPFGPSQVGADAPMQARVSAFDLLTAVAQVVGRGRLVSLDLAGSVPGLAAVQLLLSIGERPKGTSFARLGRMGTQVQTAQTRVLLTARLSALPPLLGLSVPIFLDLAPAKATLSSLACGPGPRTPSATLDVTPSLVDASVGSVSPSDLADFGTAPRIVPAPVATVLGLAAIDAMAHVTAADATPTRLAFSSADIADMTRHTATSGNLVSSLTQSLAGSLRVSVAPLDIAAPAAVTQAVGRSLAASAALLDPLVDGVLTALGLHLGQADAWIGGVRCGGGVLVN